MGFSAVSGEKNFRHSYIDSFKRQWEDLLKQKVPVYSRRGKSRQRAELRKGSYRRKKKVLCECLLLPWLQVVVGILTV